MKRAIGVCYYPEHWDETVWAEDARRMAEAGLTWVRIGEFAWSRMEPEPGRLTFDWLDRAIDTLGPAGLKVVLGTPTATPPRWMLATPPRHAGRRRRRPPPRLRLPPPLRLQPRRLPRGMPPHRRALMGERYGRHPHVAAWQTDNEYDCHATTLSYSDAARRAFRDWLAQRYQSPDALNRAWGNVFWSMEYRDWDEIDLPNLTVTEPNPSHVMDFRRFSSDQVVRFNRAQTEIIRKLTDRPLIHNYMGRTLTDSTTSPWAPTSTWQAGTATPSASSRTGSRPRPNTRRATCGRATRTCRPSTTTSTAAWAGAAGG